MKRFSLLVAISVVAVFAAMWEPAAGIVPQALRYQGNLHDPVGQPLDGSHYLTFTLHDAPWGGSALWSEGMEVQLEDGVFNVTLGLLESFPPGLFDQPLWLGISIDSEPELSDRRPLTSTAFVLDDAESLAETISSFDSQAAPADGDGGPARAERAARTPGDGSVTFGPSADASGAPGGSSPLPLGDGGQSLQMAGGPPPQAMACAPGCTAALDAHAADPEAHHEELWTRLDAQTIRAADNIDILDRMSFAATLGDKFSLFGSRFDQSNMYGFGISSGTLYYKANGRHAWHIQENADDTPRMALTSTGLGIGTNSPNHELIVQGDDPAMQIRDDTTNNSPNAARLELLERAGGDFDGGAFLFWNGETNRLLMGTKLNGVNTNVLVINRSGNNVGIGTQDPGDYRLAVNGSVRAKEVVVETGWSDFVFEPDYELPSLAAVEAHIRDHGHLPDIPSAAEVAEHGVKVGEMESRLLQKVEELTLYVIDMHKRLATLEEENARLHDKRSGRIVSSAEVRS